MADFCKACELELFGQNYLNLPDEELVLCERCGGMKPYGEITCKECNTVVKSEMYETGLELYCKCQNTLDADFDVDKWVKYAD